MKNLYRKYIYIQPALKYICEMGLIIVSINILPALLLETTINKSFFMGFIPVFILGSSHRYVLKEINIKNDDEVSMKNIFIEILKNKKWYMDKEENLLIISTDFFSKYFGYDVKVEFKDKLTFIRGPKVYVEKVYEAYTEYRGGR